MIIDKLLRHEILTPIQIHLKKREQRMGLACGPHGDEVGSIAAATTCITHALSKPQCAQTEARRLGQRQQDRTYMMKAQRALRRLLKRQTNATPSKCEWPLCPLPVEIPELQEGVKTKRCAQERG